MAIDEISDVNSNIYRILACQAQPSPAHAVFLKTGVPQNDGFSIGFPV